MRMGERRERQRKRNGAADYGIAILQHVIECALAHGARDIIGNADESNANHRHGLKIVVLLEVIL